MGYVVTGCVLYLTGRILPTTKEGDEAMTKAVSSRALSVMIALLFGLLIFWAAYFFGYLLFGQVFTVRPAYAASTFTVNSTDDPGDGVCNATECTLREAINAANATTAADTIKFNIPGSGPHTIRPLGPNCFSGGSSGSSSGSSGSPPPDPCGPLPQITNPVTIDGYSQPGSKPNTLANGDNAQLMIVLDGGFQNTNPGGLVIKAANSTVKGLVINNFGGGGVVISGSGATANKVMGNYIAGNSTDGVLIDGAPSNTVGGTTAAARNIISSNANNASGVEINGSGATGNKVQGNYIGTDKDGANALANSGDGVLIDGAPNNTIGGLMTRRSKPRNIISGNDTSGVHIKGADATGNKVQGNYVGIDKTGHSDLGNSTDGVFIDGASDNTLGGTTAGARNIISGNSSDGIIIFGSTATGNKVEGNP